MNGALTIARYAIQESLRRRVFVVVLLLSIGFLALFAWGTSAAFDEVRLRTGATDFVRESEVVGGIMLGLAMFTTLFLGSVLAVFLTMGAIRGDTERGLLQPMLVRPITRRSVLAGRFLAAAMLCAGYAIVMFLAAAAIIRWAGDWWPDRTLEPALGLAGSVALIAALAVLGSVVLSGTANGIAVFMLFGAGLVGGVLRQIGDVIDSPKLENAGTWTSWGLPFQGLYQNSLYAITQQAEGFERVIIELGPFGAAQDGGVWIWVWSAAFLVLVGTVATWAFNRRDL